MAVALGKRKRQQDVAVKKSKKDESPSEDDEDIRARFQRAFEAKFKPLPAGEKSRTSAEKELTDDDGSELGGSDDDQVDGADDEFDGFSEDENAVEVIEHSRGERAIDRETQKREMKAFMTSKPPSAADTLAAKRQQKMTAKDKQEAAQDDEAESTNLKHDLALQRLLKESHLLDSSSLNGAGSSSLAPEGKARLKALDLRLQDLGAKNALGADVKMPMSHRKGINAKASSRESKRRKEAAENGIILERPAAKSRAVGDARAVSKRRDKGIGAPGVGKFRGGMLTLSSKDLRSLSASQGSSKRGGKGKRR